MHLPTTAPEHGIGPRVLVAPEQERFPLKRLLTDLTGTRVRQGWRLPLGEGGLRALAPVGLQGLGRSDTGPFLRKANLRPHQVVLSSPSGL